MIRFKTLENVSFYLRHCIVVYVPNNTIAVSHNELGSEAFIFFELQNYYEIIMKNRVYMGTYKVSECPTTLSYTQK